MIARTLPFPPPPLCASEFGVATVSSLHFSIFDDSRQGLIGMELRTVTEYPLYS
ncbi:hypothetical protein B0T17DRAFT_12974 [Bombardia bombarda]|uniref:Uncharacterized protein n=1 Tax=Bombardia bombarda TaxID=252184 RepID=A0AA39XIJ5_9PEZI|nr:hypothetical protein B0T17DRAFT_12974 [Bombardia bombarda]